MAAASYIDCEIYIDSEAYIDSEVYINREVYINSEIYFFVSLARDLFGPARTLAPIGFLFRFVFYITIYTP